MVMYSTAHHIRSGKTKRSFDRPEVTQAIATMMRLVNKAHGKDTFIREMYINVLNVSIW